ncbi:type II secretion system assembly factor GspB [Cedecea colo]|uniref:General secretion pathway protein n=1 Tax=Cedecea colo TaxID=2552946 RepID=A0ABX0VIV2_9ENTR|nr:general secretion pathway protein [Cedecea colo]
MARQINDNYRQPRWLFVLYALLFLVLGWQGAGVWDGYHPAPACTVLSPAPPAVSTRLKSVERCEEGTLAPLRYSAHVYAQEPQQRSITLNGRQYREGSSLPCGVVVTQIQQKVTILERHGRVVVLDALEDWPSGEVNEDGSAREERP